MKLFGLNCHSCEGRHLNQHQLDSCLRRNDSFIKSIKGSIYLLLLIFTSAVYSNSTFKIDTLQLQNEFLSIQIKTKGAELISIYNKKEKFEHLWQGEKSSWNQQSPILFPIVGKLKNGGYTFEGIPYKMKNHGFASNQEFKVVSKSTSEVILELTENEETLKMYPFKFKLLVKYLLVENKLFVSNTVLNTDSKEIYFSIGAHPGFNIPFIPNEDYDDYYLEFEEKETVSRLPLTKDKGFLSNEKIENYLEDTNKMELSHTMFKDRVVILEGLKSNMVTIKSDMSKMSVTLGIENFPFVGVWTSSKKDAPFICIEPWYGISDLEDTSGDFKSKKEIQKLEVKATFEMKYYIKIN